MALLAIVLVAAIAALALAGELLIRILGIAQFPLYAIDPLTRYRMKPGQRGKFRNRCEWSYDVHGMRRAGPPPALAGATLLIGDSIVDGGAHLTQAETLAARLEALSGKPVYPVAAPGWSLANALAALPALPGWSSARRLIFILNEGDFDYIAEASSEFGFPQRYPRLMLPWLVRRRRFLRQANQRGHELGADEFPLDAGLRAANLAALASLAGQFAGDVHVMRYPKRDAGPDYDAYYDELAAAAGTRLLDPQPVADWTAACYRDSIHPNAKGTFVLADFLHEGLLAQ